MPITKQWSVVSKALLDARDDERQRAARESWQDAIDRKLIEWGRTPAALEDIGVDPPTKETIQRAIRLAEAFRDEGFPGHRAWFPIQMAGSFLNVEKGMLRKSATFGMTEPLSTSGLKVRGLSSGERSENSRRSRRGRRLRTDRRRGTVVPSCARLDRLVFPRIRIEAGSVCPAQDER